MERRDGECPFFRDKCPEKWRDFTSIGTNGDRMDQDCPMRVAINSGVYSEQTTAFIREVLARARGNFD